MQQHEILRSSFDMPKWLSYSILTILIFGVWAVIPKAATNNLSPSLMQVIATLGLVPAASTLLFSRRFTSGTDLPKGIAFAFVTGVFGNSGNLALLEALRRGGEASIIYPLTGMFPLVTVILARLFLREKLSMIQGFGVALAVLAIYLISAPGESVGHPSLHPWRNSLSTWMGYALISLFLFGICGITLKLSTQHISTELSTLCWAAGSIPVAGVILASQPLNWNIPREDWVLSVSWGALVVLGMLASFAAYRGGKASIVTALTALYPALAVMIAVPLFHERLAPPELLAIVVALAAGVALSYEPTLVSRDSKSE